MEKGVIYEYTQYEIQLFTVMSKCSQRQPVQDGWVTSKRFLYIRLKRRTSTL